jgi:hypothetical protein
MVKAVMSAKCTHAMIALKIPDWVKEIDKKRRGFLWAGKEKAVGDPKSIREKNLLFSTKPILTLAGPGLPRHVFSQGGFGP